MKFFVLPMAVLSLSLVAGGCASSRNSGWDSTGNSSELKGAELAKTLIEAKKLWQTRHVEADLRGAIEKLEAVAKSTAERPEGYEAMVLLSRGYYLLADSHLREMQERKRVWETGLSWGERAMATNPEFRKKVTEEKVNPDEALDVLGVAQVEAIYWTAVNLGKWARYSGIGTQLKYKTRIRRFIERVEALKPDYFHGAVTRYWAVFYAVAPGMAGGSLEKSKEYFDKTLKVAPGYLASHVLLAENYAPRKEDRVLFKKHLEIVIKAKPNVLMEVASENTLEQEKAKRMLADMESYF